MPSPFTRMAAIICFGPAAGLRLDRGECPDCGEKNPANTLTDELEVREFRISGLCKACQDKAFGGEE